MNAELKCAVRSASSIIALALAQLAGTPVFAQTAPTATAIVPDTVAGRSTGTTVGQPTPGAYTIDGGRYAGNAGAPPTNVFHSFERFDLATGDVARWVTPATGGVNTDVRNIVNRVTGGDPSLIFGTIDATAFPNADFYFINPAGVVFGNGFKVNAPKSFYVSTANVLRFSGGANFYTTAATANGSSFSSAAPEAFGFVAGQSGNVTFLDATRPTGPTFSFASTGEAPGSNLVYVSAANILLQNSDLNLVDSRLRMAAVGNSTLSLATNPLAVLPDLTGNVTLLGSWIRSSNSTGALRGGDAAIMISGGDIRLTGLNGVSSMIRSGRFVPTGTDPLPPPPRPSPFVPGPPIAESNATGGDVSIRADRLILEGPAYIGVLGYADTPHRLDIDIRSLLRMSGVAGSSDLTQIGTLYQAQGVQAELGNAAISIRGPLAMLEMRDASIHTLAGTGSGGPISIDVASALLDNATIISLARNGARGADISLTAGTLSILGGSAGITSRNDGFLGRGGDITLVVRGTLTMTGDSTQSTDLKRFARISSEAASGGGGGAITVDAGSVTGNYASIAAASPDGFGSGSISIITRTGDIQFSRSVVGSVTNQGLAGNVLLKSASNIDLLSTSISTFSGGFSGGGGSITLDAPKRILIGTAANSSIASTVTSRLEIDGTTNAPAGSTITIKADVIELSGLGYRRPPAPGESYVGDASRVRIAAETTGSLRAGDVIITAGSDFLTKNTDIVNLTAGGATGSAGAVTITAPVFRSDNGWIESTSTASNVGADAGTILIDARREFLVDNLSVFSSSSSGSGKAGSIKILLGASGRVAGASRIQTDIQGASGAGGTVTVTGPSAVLTVIGTDKNDPGQRSTISSSTANGQPGGTIVVAVGRLELLEGGGLLAISTEASAGLGGNISVTSGSILIDGAESGIFADSLSTTGAGNITIDSRNIRLANGGAIETDAQSGPAGSITIKMPSNGILQLFGGAQPGTITTSSATNTGGKIDIGSPLAIISSGGSIKALGELRGANVKITAKKFIRASDQFNELAVNGDLFLDAQVEDVSRGTDSPVVDFANAFGVLISNCADVRSAGAASSLTVATPGPFEGGDKRCKALVDRSGDTSKPSGRLVSEIVSPTSLAKPGDGTDRSVRTTVPIVREPR